jgi:hypothetical protein
MVASSLLPPTQHTGKLFPSRRATIARDQFSVAEPSILRTRRDEEMADLCSAAENLAASIAAEHGLMHSIDYHEIFVASVNAPDAVDCLLRAFDDEGI